MPFSWLSFEISGQPPSEQKSLPALHLTNLGKKPFSRELLLQLVRSLADSGGVPCPTSGSV